MKNYICNLVIPGAGKSGTSSLHDLLDQHPEINMSKPKEPQHFSFDDLYDGGAEAHNSLFKFDATYRYYGESSQCYMIHPIAMKRIKEHLSSPKVILLLRDPVERLWSQYRWNYRLTVERAPLMQALEKRGDDTGYSYDSIVKMYREHGGYFAFSRYSYWIPLWRETFGKDNVLILKTKNLKTDPGSVMGKCFAFLDIAPFDIQDRARRNETSKTIRLPSLPLVRMERRLPSIIRNSPLYAAPRWQLLRAFTPTPPEEIPPEELNHVHEYLHEDVVFYESLAT